MPRGVKKLLDGATSTTTGTPYAFAPAPPSDIRKVFATVSGTGAVSATIVVDAGLDGIDGWAPAFTISLSGTTSDSYIGWLEAGNGNFYRARLTAVSGTGAAVTVAMEE